MTMTYKKGRNCCKVCPSYGKPEVTKFPVRLGYPYWGSHG